MLWGGEIYENKNKIKNVLKVDSEKDLKWYFT